MVSVLAIGPKVRRFKPGGGDGFSRAIKICSMPSFRGEVKLEAQGAIQKFPDSFRCCKMDDGMEFCQQVVLMYVYFCRQFVAMEFCQQMVIVYVHFCRQFVEVSYNICGRLSGSNVWENVALIGCYIMTMLLLPTLSLQ
jgi:hypothetical protein